jgi:CRISPR-associated endonuclease/helicase Cas3
MSSYKNFVAKTDKEDKELWLPLWMHHRDTVGVMEKLINKWLPLSTIYSTGLKEDEFKKAAIFIAGTHDIGKANSYFQSIITKELLEKRLELEEDGFVINNTYLNSGKVPHAYVSEEILKFILENVVEDKYKLNAYASVLGAHHGKPNNNQNKIRTSDGHFIYETEIFGRENSAEYTRWINVWNEILEDAYKLSGINEFEELPVISLQAQMVLSGLLIMADWMASNQYYFHLIGLQDSFQIENYDNRIMDAWNLFEFPERWESEISYMDDNIFEDRFGFLPNEVQREFVNIVNNSIEPGLFILEAQMGVGKTEAALAAAEVLANRREADGIFFGLPTQATSNGLFSRLVEWAKEISEDTYNSIKLAHGSADLNKEYQKYNFYGKSTVNEDAINEGIEIHPWFQGNKKSLLADFVIGTVDQFLLASLKRKHLMLRHLGLSGKIVIIDECHAYDTYMNEYLLASLRWMGAYGVPVIMLSATLPKEQRKNFINEYSKYYIKCFLGKKGKHKPIIENEDWDKSDAYPLFTWTDGNSIKQKTIELTIKSKEVTISYERTIEDMLMKVFDKTNNAGCACIIANTVREAQEIYYEAKKRLRDYTIILYHAQFIMADRMKKEEELLSRLGKKSTIKERKNVLLIGTQVLEQSLDYDVDILVTQLCPMDLLLQRIGRLHRHVRDGSDPNKIRSDRLKKPEAIVLLNGDEDQYDSGTKSIYGDYLLKRTMKELEINNNRVVVPNDISRMVQQVYDFDFLYGDEEKDKRIFDYEREDKVKRADAYALCKPQKSRKAKMDGMLNVENDEEEAEAAVRDGVESIEVIVLKKTSDHCASILEDVNYLIDMNQIPLDYDAKMLVTQKLRLPSFFSSKYRIHNTLKYLEDITIEEVPIWQESSWLNGELFIFLDEDGKALLGNCEISYTFSEGFRYKEKVSD